MEEPLQDSALGTESQHISSSTTEPTRGLVVVTPLVGNNVCRGQKTLGALRTWRQRRKKVFNIFVIIRVVVSDHPLPLLRLKKRTRLCRNIRRLRGLLSELLKNIDRTSFIIILRLLVRTLQRTIMFQHLNQYEEFPKKD